jgi:acetyl-CoA carboxylase biotin carboxyl carrier protein
MDINTDKIKELADLAIEKGLAELIVQDGEKSVTIKLPGSNVQVQAIPLPQQATPQSQPQPQPQPAASGTAADAPKLSAVSDERLVKITSPMVGTFYGSPSPDSPPYVNVGQTVSKGQVVCIIEAMKMMNELESEASGKIVRILVENGQPVEFGQVLMLVEPA